MDTNTGVAQEGVIDMLSKYFEKKSYRPTQREYFAAMAMQGIRANSIIRENNGYLSSKTLAANSILDADALIAELNREAK